MNRKHWLYILAALALVAWLGYNYGVNTTRQSVAF